MAKITYVEHGGKEHVVEVANGLTVRLFDVSCLCRSGLG